MALHRRSLFPDEQNMRSAEPGSTPLLIDCNLIKNRATVYQAIPKERQQNHPCNAFCTSAQAENLISGREFTSNNQELKAFGILSAILSNGLDTSQQAPAILMQTSSVSPNNWQHICITYWLTVTQLNNVCSSASGGAQGHGKFIANREGSLFSPWALTPKLDVWGSLPS